MKSNHIGFFACLAISGCISSAAGDLQNLDALSEVDMTFTEGDRPLFQANLTCMSASTARKSPSMYQFDILPSSQQIDADWGYNNDWGWWYFDGNVPAVRSCMKKDGTGWYFDLEKKYSSGTPHAWMSPSLIAGDTGWDHFGNKWSGSKDFPVRVANIDTFKVALDYNYQFSGMGNTQVRLNFQDKSVPISSASKGPFETELMVWLRHNVLVSERRDPNFYKAPGSTTERFSVGGASWFGYLRPPEAMGEKFEFQVAEVHLPNSSASQSGQHQFYLDLGPLIRGLVEAGWIDATDILIGLEFKNEIWFGSGKMDIERFSYEIVKR